MGPVGNGLFPGHPEHLLVIEIEVLVGKRVEPFLGEPEELQKRQEQDEMRPVQQSGF